MQTALNKISVEIEDLLDSATASHWLKYALRSALERDLVDAAREAELLARILVQRRNAVEQLLQARVF